MLGTHVDDLLWANEPEIDHLVEGLLKEFNVGTREENSFRFCGNEISQDADGTIRKTCEATARKLKPINISAGRTPYETANDGEKAQLKSVAASLGLCARQVGPQYAYRASEAKKAEVKGTVKDMKDTNKLVEHVVETASRGLTFKAGLLDWDTMNMEIVTISDASNHHFRRIECERGRRFSRQGRTLSLTRRTTRVFGYTGYH